MDMNEILAEQRRAAAKELAIKLLAHLNLSAEDLGDVIYESTASNMFGDDRQNYCNDVAAYLIADDPSIDIWNVDADKLYIPSDEWVR